MSSLNINTISNKPHFKNYFSDPITLPKNSMISLPKSNLKIPINIQPVVRAPLVLAGDYGQAAIEIGIDGLFINITWQEIYDAHSSFNTTNDSCEDINLGEGSNPGTIANYYANYKYLPNAANIYLGQNVADANFTNKIKIPFDQVLAKAIDTKLEFYECSSASTYSGDPYALGVASRSDTSVNSTLINLPLRKTGGDRIQALVDSFSSLNQSRFGLNFTYAPHKMTTAAIQYINFNNANIPKSGWTVGPVDNHRLTAPAVAPATICACFVDERNIKIDPNGGWVKAIPNLQSQGNMAFGLNMVGAARANGYLADFSTSSTIDDVLSLIDIGFVFSQDASGNNRWSVVDRGITYPGPGETAITPGDPLAGPAEFTNNADTFYIKITRGGLFDGTTRFVFNLYVGSGPLDSPPNTDDTLVYTTTVADDNATFAGGDQNPVVCILNDAAAIDNTIHQVSFIQKTDQSEQQGNNLVPFQGSSYVNSISLNVLDTDGEDRLLQGYYQFWNSWGINNIAQVVDVESTVYGSDINNGIRKWSVPTNFSEVETKYYMGIDNINQLLVAKDTGFLDLNANSFQLNNLPTILKVSCNNLDVKNFNGNFISAQGNGPSSGVLESSSLTRLIGTIPLDTSDVNVSSQTIDVNYEPFNLIYRPINNSRAFTINYLDIEIFFRDFDTGQRKSINNVVGTIDLDIHIKTGPAPPKIDEQSLRPL